MTGDCLHWAPGHICDCKAARMRRAVRVCIEKGLLKGERRTGAGSRLAEYFGVRRQRISQIIREEVAR